MLNKYTVSASVTGRSAEKLSRHYGYETLENFAGSIPENAKVIDVAAGRSNLGLSVAAIRDDIKWIDLDIRKGWLNFAKRKQRKGTPNYQFIRGDVLNLPFASNSVDLIYTSWLLPHIEMDSTELAISAVHSMSRLLKESGTLHACRGFTHAKVDAADYARSPEDESRKLVEAMKLTGFARTYNAYANTQNHIFQIYRQP